MRIVLVHDSVDRCGRGEVRRIFLRTVSAGRTL